ncbi:phosphatase PAP2 family protein [Saccharothrix tamanrassetensis]
MVLAVLMAFARVFVGAHYPHDVMVGLLLGAIVAWPVVRLCTTVLLTRFAGHRVVGRLLLATPPAPR